MHEIRIPVPVGDIALQDRTLQTVYGDGDAGFDRDGNAEFLFDVGWDYQVQDRRTAGGTIERDGMPDMDGAAIGQA